MNILWHELKMSFRSWLYFTIGMLGMLAAFAAFFNMFKQDAALFEQLLQNFPKEFRAAFGFSDVNLAESDGYLSFLFTYIVLIGAVFGMKTGVALLSEEMRSMTADFLITKPVPRARIVAFKLLVSLIWVFAQFVLVFALGLPLVSLIIKDPVNPGIFALLSLATLLVQLFFIGIGIFLAALLNKIKQVTPIALGVVFFFFIIELVNQSIQEKGLTFLTPFSYFKGSYIVAHRCYDSTYLFVDLAVFILLTLAGAWLYQKRDMHAA